MASKTCKIQLPILGLYPDDSEFKKGFESILEQEKPGYIEQLGLQWNHFYLGRVRPLVSYNINIFGINYYTLTNILNVLFSAVM